MNSSEHVNLSRETAGVSIPDGTYLTLPEGTSVQVAQSLGDTFTVVTPWGQMVRIDAKDADAIGREAPEVAAVDTPTGGSLEDQVWSQLRTCYDPEIPVNIVDLGLIYDCSVAEQGGDEAQVGIKMTLTAPGCGMGQIIADDVQRKVEALPGVAAADVELVFDPPWTQNMMTEAARLQLGLF